MSIDVNAIEQTVVVTAVGDEVNVNIIDQPVLVSVTDQIIEVEASGGTGPQGPAGAGVATGGTTGQVLSKASNTNYDTVWVDAGAGTVYSVDASGSTGISVTGGPITGAGTLTITNTAPDQVVALTGAGTAVITGTYPNFTITTNDEFDGTVTSVNLTAGTGISVSGGPITGSGSISVTNTSPDQVVSLTGGGTTTISGTYPNFTITSTDSKVGTVTSVDMTVPTGLTISGNPITSAGTLALALASGYSIPTTASQANWNTAYNDSITSASVSGTSTKTLTLNQQDGGTIQASWTDDNTDAVTSVFGRTGAVTATEGDYTLTQLGDVTLTSPTNGQVLKYNGTTWVNNTDTDTGLTSVGLSMPSAFAVANSPLTSNGTIAVTGAGTSAQYVRGDGQLANFPTNGGGGSSVNYYLNGSVSQGTFGGDTYYEMSKTPIIGAGTNFTRTNAQGNGYIASFITDAGDPALLNIPGGNWNVEFYFQASSGGGNPSFYAELYKVSSSNVFTLIASGSTNPEGITQGTVVDQYFTSIPVAQTALLATDRIAVRIFVTPSGRNITLHTENSNLCEVLTTFSTGLNALNGLTAQVQYFATSTIGTDFNIQSLTDTHTLNLPVASGSNTGKLSNVDWLTFDGKENVLTFSAPLSRSVNTVSIPVANTSQPGYLDSTDWTTFNAKVTSVSATSPLFSTGGKTPTLTIQQSSGSQNGYLSSTDWSTFNGKQNAITLTTTGSSGASTFISNTLNVPTYTLSGLGGVPTTRQLTINGTAYDLSADRSWTIPVHDAVTIGTANGLSLSTQVLSLGLSSSSANGALSSTDWTTFNSKQDALSGTGFVKISGTTISYDNSTYALDSAVVHNTGTETVAGAKTFTSQMTVSTGPASIVIKPGNSSNGGILWRNSVNAGHWSITSDPSSTGAQGVWDFRNDSLSQSCFSVAPTTNIVTFSSNVIASSLIKSGGTSSQYLMADGSTSTLTNPVTGTGTTNYLPKWTSGSAIGNSLAQDTGSSINIGTATTYPATKLVVGGASAIGGIVSEDTAGTGSFVRILGDATNGNLINYKNGTSLRFASSAADFTTFTEHARLTSGGNLLVNSTTDNGNRLQVTGNGYFSGNVGIGTASPSGKLDVFSSSDVYTNISTSGNATSAVLSLYNSLGVTDGAAIGYNVAMRFGTITGLNAAGFSEKMRLTSSGNLGLGVTPSAWNSPFKVFQVGSTTALWDISSVSGLSNNLYNDGTGRYLTTNFASIFEHSSGQFRWLTAPSGTAGNAITFTQAMTLTANGRLLLGTTTEGTYLLDVNGTGRFSGNAAINGTIIGTDQTFGGAYRTFAFGTNSNGFNRIFAANDNSDGLYLNSATGRGIFFRVNGGGSNVFSLDSTGAATFSSSVTATSATFTNGVSNTQLTVNGSGAIKSGINFANGGTTYGQIYFDNNSPYDMSVLQQYTTGSLILGTNNTERMRITSGGNIGIGTSSPSYLLDVNRSSLGTIAQFITNDGTYNPRLFINGTVDGMQLFATYSTTAGSLMLGTGGVERIRITSGGNLLVGTTTDSGEKLQVSGSVKTTGNIYMDYNNPIRWKSSSGDYRQIISYADDTYIDARDGGMILRTGTGGNASERMRIKSNGSVRYIPMATPASAEAGDVYYDSTSNKLRCYNGTSWNDLF